MLKFQTVTTGYPGAPVSEGLSLRVEAGEILTLIGPNGCGKTTLLKTAAGLLSPRSGRVLLEGRGIEDYAPKELAHRRAYLPQGREVPDITVGALVAHGRFPYLGFSRQMTARDREAVERAMEWTGVAQWKDRRLGALSGGQRQRVYLAMTVAQDTPLLLWDEPATYLDVNHRLAILELVRKLNREGRTVVMTLHDLADALTVSHRVALMDGAGRLVQVDSPERLFASGAIDRVFGMRSEQVRLADGSAAYVFTNGE